MNNTIVTYSIMPSLNEGIFGECKTLAEAKKWAYIYGTSMIYVRYDGEISGSAFMVKQVTKWTLLSASEEDFAN
mgnify:CR=1 FL=1